MTKLPKRWTADWGLIDWQELDAQHKSDPIIGGGITGETIVRVQLTLTLYVQAHQTISNELPMSDLLYGLYNGSSLTPNPEEHNQEPRQWLLHGRISAAPLVQLSFPLATPNQLWIVGSTRVEVESLGQRQQGGIHPGFRIAGVPLLESFAQAETWTLFWHIRYLKAFHPPA